MKNKKVIFFDLDGTILDVSERIYRVYKDIMKKYNKKFLSKDKYLKLKRRKMPVEEILKKTKAEDIFLKFKKEWEREIEKPHYLELDKISDFEKKILLNLKSNYKLVLVMLRNHPKRLVSQLREKKIDRIFDKILVKSARDYQSKWKLKYNLIKKYGDYDKGSIVVGDTETDILAGKKLKIKTVAVIEGMRNREILGKCKSDFLIKNITELNQCNF